MEWNLRRKRKIAATRQANEWNKNKTQQISISRAYRPKKKRGGIDNKRLLLQLLAAGGCDSVVAHVFALARARTRIIMHFSFLFVYQLFMSASSSRSFRRSFKYFIWKYQHLVVGFSCRLARRALMTSGDLCRHKALALVQGIRLTGFMRQNATRRRLPAIVTTTACNLQSRFFSRVWFHLIGIRLMVFHPSSTGEMKLYCIIEFRE